MAYTPWIYAFVQRLAQKHLTFTLQTIPLISLMPKYGLR